MEGGANGPSLGQMIVDKVKLDYPDYAMTVKVRKEDRVKCVEVRDVLRLGNELPAPYATNYPWGNAQNLIRKIRTVLKKNPSTDPHYAACTKIAQFWGEGQGTQLVELEKAVPIIIVELSKILSTKDEIIKALSAFIKEKTGEEEEGGQEEDSVNSLSSKFAELRPGCRIRTTTEKPQRVSAIDLVVVVGGQSRDAARQTVQAKLPTCPAFL